MTRVTVKYVRPADGTSFVRLLNATPPQVVRRKTALAADSGQMTDTVREVFFEGAFVESSVLVEKFVRVHRPQLRRLLRREIPSE